MRIELRNDSVLLDGYVNAVERNSKPLITEHGKCYEQIEARAFGDALERSDNVDLLLNHDTSRNLGSVKEGNLELFEDNIGLRAICTVTDEEVIQLARDNKLKGWSFGMIVEDDSLEERAEQLPIRHVKKLDLLEVSLIAGAYSPCYVGTSVEQRAGKEVTNEVRSNEFRAVTEDLKEKQLVDYSTYENRIKAVKQA